MVYELDLMFLIIRPIGPYIWLSVYTHQTLQTFLQGLPIHMHLFVSCFVLLPLYVLATSFVVLRLFGFCCRHNTVLSSLCFPPFSARHWIGSCARARSSGTYIRSSPSLVAVRFSCFTRPPTRGVVWTQFPCCCASSRVRSLSSLFIDA